MSLIADKLRSPLRLLLAAMLLLALSFIGNMPRAAAMDEHPMHTADISMDCATACARNASLPAPETILKENENQLPDPDRPELTPHHLQFAILPATDVSKPTDTFGSSLARPPDIVKLSGNFRF